jgi:hypothetical protein
MDPAEPRRFRVALSFPGEHRSRVEIVARALAANLGREKVLYDRWYAAKRNLAEAERLIAETGYHRRDRELAELRAKVLP